MSFVPAQPISEEPQKKLQPAPAPAPTPTAVPQEQSAVPVEQVSAALPLGAQADGCLYCDGAQPLTEQFYETKLFRVLVRRDSITEGHVVIIPKRHDPHFYSFDLDQLEEFGYLIKKVSFIAMRMTQAPGFSLVMSDGTSEVMQNEHLEIHIIPRQYNDPKFMNMLEVVHGAVTQLDDTAIAQHVNAMRDLMQLPQER